MIRGGKLRHPVMIQQKETTVDSYGGETFSWSLFARTWAGIWPTKSKEMVINDKLTLVTRFTIGIRWIPGVTAGMRINARDGRIFEILSIKNQDEKDKFLDLLCREDA